MDRVSALAGLLGSMSEWVRGPARPYLEALFAPTPEYVDQTDRWVCDTVGKRRYIQACRSRHIQCRQVGRLWVARRADVEAWLGVGRSEGL